MRGGCIVVLMQYLLCLRVIHIYNFFVIKNSLVISLFLCLHLCVVAQATDSSLLFYVESESLCASFEWQPNFNDDNGTYSILARFPDADTFVVLQSDIAARRSRYCFNRQLCGDTVVFLLQFFSSSGASPFCSSSVGDLFDDRRPTTPCLPGVATVDNGAVRISWHPSPDADIMGYYICTGRPAEGYDTVWGRLDTSYLCLDHSANVQHYYRVLAFDSCFRASALSDYFGNVVLSASSQPCVRHLSLSWSPYEGLPAGVDRYELLLANNTNSPQLVFSSPNVLSFEYDVPDTVSSLQAVVRVVGRDSSAAFSNVVFYQPDAVDSARYLNILSCQYDMEQGAVVLTAELDSSFHGEAIYVYRASDSGTFSLLATLPYQVALSFSDFSVSSLNASTYLYRIAVFDRCGVRLKYSDVSFAVIPSMDTKGAIFPNVFTPAAADNNLFCGYFRFLDPQYYSLHIYTRRGALVFSSSNPRQCWDGTSSGRRMPQGVYVYVLRCRYYDGSVQSLCGTVLLID